jgi:hypothetical protein
MLLGVAVVLAAAAPVHAIADGRVVGYRRSRPRRPPRMTSSSSPHRSLRDARREARDEAHMGANDTGNSLSRRYYGNHRGR